MSPVQPVSLVDKNAISYSNGNILTDCMEDLLGGDDHPGISMKYMNLERTQLSQADIECLFSASRDGKPCIHDPPTTDNEPATPTDCPSVIPSAVEHHDFPHRHKLPLENRGLNRNDIRNLSEVVHNGKFPHPHLSLLLNRFH